MIPRQPGAASDPARNAATNAGSRKKQNRSALRKKSDRTIPAPAAAEKNTKNAAEEPQTDNGGLGFRPNSTETREAGLSFFEKYSCF